jgi:phosphatidylinositol alpha-1,6-mannosyltransferase
MRILAIVTEAFGGYGGIAQYNRDLLHAMSHFRSASRIDVLPRYARGPFDALPAGVRQHPAHPQRARFAASAIALATQVRPDLVFCGHLHLGPLTAWIARRHRAALIHQTHGVEVWSRPSQTRRRGLEAADAVLCVSRDTRAKVINWADMPLERLRVVPNTVSEDFTPPVLASEVAATRARLGLEGRKVILSVSRLDAGQRHKGQDRIIEAMPALLARGLDVVYLIAGVGDDAPRLKSLAAELGLGERVRFLGMARQSDLPDLYRAADLFALPSTGDGFGIVFIEAMACGTPALGLDAGGVPDALADGELGVLTTRSDLANALARALEASERDPTLARRVVQRFGREAFRRRLEAVFTGAAEAGPLRRAAA